MQLRTGGLTLSLLSLIQIESESEVSQLCPTLQPHGPQPTKLLHPWNSLGKSTGVGCHFLLQGIFPTQGLNLGLQHCRRILYHLTQHHKSWQHTTL